MATKSILKTVDIKDRRTAQAFVRALENAKDKRVETVERKRTFSDAGREEIEKMFGDKK